MPTKRSSSSRPARLSSAVYEGPLGQILDGQAIARDVHDQVRRGVERLMNEHRIRPGPAAILVGEDPGSKLYDSQR